MVGGKGKYEHRIWVGGGNNDESERTSTVLLHPRLGARVTWLRGVQQDIKRTIRGESEKGR